MTAAAQPWAARGTRLCARCATELAPDALACPACHALVHAAALTELASRAESLAAAGDERAARDAWAASLAMLPHGSQQHAAVRERIAGLDRRIAAATPASRTRGVADANDPWWKRSAAGAVTLVVLVAGKLKLLALGLLKAKTLFSMFAFFGVYWSMYGWPLALGFALSIYIHEMGHVAMLRRYGIDADAPLFIPGVGALVLLREHIDDPHVDAAIGLAGPVWGLGAGLAAYAVAKMTGAPIWMAIAHLTGWINLFNLTPVWQLDGSRGFHALAPAERWMVVAAMALAFVATQQKLLLIVGAVAVYRAVQRPAGPGDRRALATFVLLVAALSWMSVQHA